MGFDSPMYYTNFFLFPLTDYIIVSYSLYTFEVISTSNGATH